MKKNKLMWAAALPLAFAACSQEEIVNNPSEVTPEAVAQFKGVQVVENPQFSISREDDGALTRMATTGGVIDWEDGDKVGLVWLNAMAISNNFVYGQPLYSDWYPTDSLHYSNTRITNEGDQVFSMQDGQLYAGQYIAYHPYDENMKQVGIFSLKQDSVQTQSTAAVVNDAAYDYLAKNMNWLSRNADNKTGKSSFLYHIDANKAGLVKTIHIPMRRYSNIFEARFTEVNGPVSSIEWADLTINRMELIASENVFPVETRFHFNEGIADTAEYELVRAANGGYVEIDPEEWDKDNNPIANYEKDAAGYPAKFYVGLQQVGPTASLPALVDDADETWYRYGELAQSVTLKIDAPAQVSENPEVQRAMFLLMPTTKAKELEGALTLRLYTDYGYIDIPESAWKAYIGVDPDPVVNGTNWGSQNMFQSYAGLKEAGKTATELLSLIGQKITRFVPVNTDDLVYNDIEVNNMDELLEALDKWNKLGEDGEFRVYVTKSDNNFENFDWGTGSQYEEVTTFLADNQDNLKITANQEMNLSGETKLNDKGNDLEIVGAVEQTNGTMNVQATETIATLTIASGAKLDVNTGKGLNGTTANLKGTADVNGFMAYDNINNSGILNVNSMVTANNHLENDGTANVVGTVLAETVTNDGAVAIASTGEVQAITSVTNNNEMTLEQNGKVVTEKLDNNKNIVTNGDIKADAINNNANGDYHMLSHSSTEVGAFSNAGEIYYDQQGGSFKYTNVNGGKSIATVTNDVNYLADYILAANSFKCTDLIINPNDNLTTTQWDNSLKSLGFTSVTMNDGVIINFNKDLAISKATVTIPAGATVSWKKSDTTIDTPVFTVSKVVVNSGTTLNVEGISVKNAKKTEVNFGNDGDTVTISGMSNFAKDGVSEIPAGGNNGTIVIK